VQLTDRDRLLLAFAAEHRFVVADQLAVALGAPAGIPVARLRALTEAGYLRRERRLHGQPPSYAVTGPGLRATSSDLPAPRRVDPATYRHDLGLGWLMLVARDGRFGAASDVIGERRMRSHDGRHPRAEERFGVRLGGHGPGGRERLHYPDMVVMLESGHRVAFELELTTKSPRRRDEIIGAYAVDRRIDAVVYLVERPEAGRAIERTAARAGVPDLVHVQRVAFGTDGAGKGVAAVAQRAVEAQLAAPRAGRAPPVPELG
jgi:hypothetical protein